MYEDAENERTERDQQQVDCDEENGRDHEEEWHSNDNCNSLRACSGGF